MPKPCLFCQMVDGDIEVEVVHSSEKVLAFRDINPQASTHILLIPKDHVPSAREVKRAHADMLAELFLAAAHLARAEGVDKTGWRLVTNVGDDAGQSVHHLHFHLIGGRKMGWPPG